MKKYKAHSNVSIVVALPGGATKRISFQQQTLGGSVYYTADEDEQKGLESHYQFGTLFFAEQLPAAAAKKPKAKCKTEPPAGTANEAAADCDAQQNEYEFPDAGSAKEWLCDKYGISRTKIKSVKDIESTAESLGIIVKVKE